MGIFIQPNCENLKGIFISSSGRKQLAEKGGDSFTIRGKHGID